MSTDRSGRLLPLLEKCLGHLLLQLVCGLLPRLTSAIAHLHRVLAWAMDLGFLGMSGRNRQKDTKKQQALHRVLLGLVSMVWALSAGSNCLGAKGLNGLLDLAAPE